MNKNLSIEQFFSLAYQSHKKNDFKTAENYYNEVLTINPNHFEANFLLGTVYAQSRKFELAHRFLNKALKIQPTNINVYNNLGSVLKEMGKKETAMEYYKKVIQIDSSFIQAHNNLGILFMELGQYQKSIECFERAIIINPKYADAHNNLGVVYKNLGEYRKSIKCFERAIIIIPKYADAHNNLGIVYKNLREYQKSVECFEQTIAIKPQYADAYNNLGLIYRELGNFEKEINYYKKTIEIQNNHSIAHYNLGNAYKALGDFNKAITSYEKSISYKSENLLYYYNLSGLNNKILDISLKNKITKIINYRNCSIENKVYGNFLLSKYENKKKNYGEEFKLLEKGHKFFFELNALQFNHKVEYFLNKLPEMIKEKNEIKIDKEDIYKYRPIFIIGVPRCGSTLIEKLIASGKNLIPIGEETGIFTNLYEKRMLEGKNIYNDIKNFKGDIIKNYEKKNLIKEKNKFIFTDKSLDNFYYIPLIKQIFPNAKVINCKRNVLSSIMSIFKNNLPYLAWAHNLDHIFKYFDNYFKILKGFNKIYPNFIYELEFEKLINDPVNESKKLMNYCELQWDNKCLEFYKRKDLISKTASNIQIRQGIYRHSLDKYLPYQKFLNVHAKKYSWYN